MSSVDTNYSLPTIGEFATGTVPTVSTEKKKEKVANRRVLHIINGEYYSGAERVQDLLAARLPKFGYDIGFACIKPDQFAVRRQYKDAPIYDASVRSKFDLRAIKELRNVVKENGFQAVHAHTPRSAVFARIVSGFEDVPMIYHVHSPASRDSTRSFVNRIKSMMERLSLTGVDRLITVSEGLSRHMQNLGYSPQLINVVPNGVPCVQHVPQRPTPDGVWLLGTVALFRPRKGTETLLEALQILRIDNQFDVRLRAVGEFETPAYERSLKDYAQKLGIEDAVDWVGFQSDINAELQKLDVFVLPSHFGEGMPMVILEAMANGIPPVGTAIDGVGEVIRDGIDGMIAKPNDAADLATQIAAIVDGDISWQHLRSSAIDRQVNHFSDTSMARKVAEVYDGIFKAAKQPVAGQTGESATASQQPPAEPVV